MRKVSGIFFVLLLLSVLMGKTVRAEEEIGRITGGFLEKMDFSEVQEMLDEFLGKESFSVSEAVKRVMHGGGIVSGKQLRDMLRILFLERYETEKEQLRKVLILLLFAAVFSAFSAAFENRQAGESGFYIIYLLIFTLLIQTFSRLSLSLAETMESVAELMKSLVPAYFLTLVAAEGTVTAMLFYQGILLLVWMIQWLLVNLLLPACNLYLLLCLINALSREEMLGRMAELLKSLISWSFHTMISVILGLQVIRSLVAPIMDSLKRSALGKTAGALPGIGNAINGVTELILSCAVLIRNSLGVVVLVILVMIGVSPLIHFAFLTVSYRFLAAVVQPVSDSRIIKCLGSMGDGCALLMRLFLTMELMCILCFFILLISFGGRI